MTNLFAESVKSHHWKVDAQTQSASSLLPCFALHRLMSEGEPAPDRALTVIASWQRGANLKQARVGNLGWLGA